MEVPVFVSITVIASRLGNLVPMLRSVVCQSRRPDRIILNISSVPFMLDTGVSFTDLPAEVRAMAMAGDVEIYRVENIGSYRKLIPTLRRFRGDFIVVTADDDVLYPSGWLEGLCAAHARHDCVIAYRTREMLLRDSGGVQSYETWPHSYYTPETAGKASFYRIPTGRGGVLYRSSYFNDLSLLEQLRQLAPGQDDVSFRLACMLADVPVVWIPYFAGGKAQNEFHGFHYNDSLFSRNADRVGSRTPNDLALEALLDYCREHRLLNAALVPLLPRG